MVSSSERGVSPEPETSPKRMRYATFRMRYPDLYNREKPSSRWDSIRGGSIDVDHFVEVNEAGHVNHDIQVDMIGGVAVLLYRRNPLTGAGEIGTILQKRATLAQFYNDDYNPEPYETFPLETMEEGETPLETAVRGVKEEAGITISPKDLREVDTFTDFPLVSISQNRGFGFVADVTHGIYGQNQLDENESIGKVRWRSVVDMHRAIRHMRSSFSMALWSQWSDSSKYVWPGSGPWSPEDADSYEIQRPYELDDVEIRPFEQLNRHTRGLLDNPPPGLGPCIYLNGQKIPQWDLVTAGPYTLVHAVEINVPEEEINKNILVVRMPNMVYGVFYRNNNGRKEILLEQDGEYMRFPKEQQRPREEPVPVTLRMLRSRKMRFIGEKITMVGDFPLLPKITGATAKAMVAKVSSPLNEKQLWVPYRAMDDVKKIMRDPHSLAIWSLEEQARGSIIK